MTLRPESKDVEELVKKLEEIGWVNGHNLLKFKPHNFVENYYFPKFLEKKIKEINSELFSNLTPSDEEEVLNYVHSELQNASEERILDYLKHGVPVVVNGESCKIMLIDYSGKKNSFFYLTEAKFRGSPQNSKLDITLFINGIPVVVIEVKAESLYGSHFMALDQIRRYEMFSPELFRFVQFGIAYGDEKFYTPTFPNWKKKVGDSPAFNWTVELNENGKKVRKNDILDLLIPRRVIEFIKYFIFFRKPREGELDKLIARSNQYRATKKAIKRIKEHMEKSGKNRGLIWHWQGWENIHDVLHSKLLPRPLLRNEPGYLFCRR